MPAQTYDLAAIMMRFKRMQKAVQERGCSVATLREWATEFKPKAG